MSRPYFEFRQFTVFHDKCAMKVNTDGCLLGAWADHGAPQNILDIGSGSGVIALMMAQKFAEACIDAVEIDSICAEQCRSNLEKSPWANRLKSIHSDILKFSPHKRYDLIVSNPPYFQKALLSSDQVLNYARHQIALNLSDLLRYAKNHLTKNGSFCVVLPADQLQSCMNLALRNQLYILKKTAVQSLPDKNISRYLLHFTLVQHSSTEEIQCIECGPGEYSPWFKSLLSEYYIKL
jgi:tRNA1Val (adenine37-N6)-methyltransferase